MRNLLPPSRASDACLRALAPGRVAGNDCKLLAMQQKQKVHEHKILKDLMMGELQVLEDTSHPNVMRIYELLHDDNFYFIVSEFIRYGELFDFITQRSQSHLGSLTEQETKHIIKQLLYALNYMHYQGIVHRDIKPGNMLLAAVGAGADQEFTVVLGDCGASTQRTVGGAQPPKRSSLPTTRHY